MIKNGMRTKEIAQLRGISEATVNRHREHIRRKLQITNSDVNLATHLHSVM
jgi:DNA-binding CsgD family transcriptional regulator